ncbi:GNAT family N-acetyltransferase [Vibrio parahaemolyticus]|nr:GNAT family N-acetyltransferase [Vibrio parahaemolyticus]
MQYIEVRSSQIPLDLLLEADPSEASISSYLSDSWCFAALDNGRVLAACIVKPQANSLAEIFNVSVYPKLQGQGVGSELLKSVLSQLSSKGISRVELGTGTFGYQLTYYQRLGFRVDSIVKDHFLLNYPEPIYENGIQHNGYFLPSEGANNVALALFTFESLSAYEDYRTKSQHDPECIKAFEFADKVDCIISYERSFFRPVLG